MPSIQLQAKLRAYTRAPFYSDYIREAPQDGEQYVRLNGKWVTLETSLFEDKLNNFQQMVTELQTQLDAVDIRFNSTTNQLIFVDGYGNETFVTLPGTNVDFETIGLTDTNALYVMDTPDNTTIKVVDVVTKPSVLDESVSQKVSGKLRVDGVYAEKSDTVLKGQDILDRISKAEKNISDLESYTQGKGGFLDPHNFGTDLKNAYLEEIDSTTGYTRRDLLLNERAYVELNNGVPFSIPDQTKIKNLFDGHIWVFISIEDRWVDEGADTIVNANNHGVVGAVTGTAYNPEDPSTKFKISIEENENNVATGVMSVNGLEQEFKKVVYKTETDNVAIPNTYVRRTLEGTVTTAESVNDTDAVNRGEFYRWMQTSTISDEEIAEIVTSLYLPDIQLIDVSV